jgi:signal transduction histidine kinase
MVRLNARSLVRRMTFRARLAAGIVSLFLLSGTALLAFVVLLARYGTATTVQQMRITHNIPTAPPSTGLVGGTTTAGGKAKTAGNAELSLVNGAVQAVQDTALHQMLLWSGVGLVVTALLAGAIGWWLSGRALRPVAAMTDAARRISDQNLHERLDLAGPDDELHRLASTFDLMLDRLEKSFDSQRRFVANASHELRTPLAVQRTSLEVGFADPLPEHLAEVRDDLLESNRDAERLISALLLLARTDRGLTSIEHVDLAATVRRAAEELTGPAQEHDVEIEISGSASVVVSGDSLLLHRLASNLLHNAIVYNRPGGRVRVELGPGRLTVANTGQAVPAERVNELFEPFRRLGRERTATSGHGLGLSIVRSIAEAHRAAIEAAPGPEGGLTITVRAFPEADVSEHAD